MRSARGEGNFGFGFGVGIRCRGGLVPPSARKQPGGRENPAPTHGMPLADLLGLSDDVVMDIEVTSNRVDSMGMVGMAREASAILNKKFLWKPAKIKNIQFPIYNFQLRFPQRSLVLVTWPRESKALQSDLRRGG